MKKPKQPDIDNLPERIHEAITLGPESKEEADEKFPNQPGAPDLGYLAREGGVKFRAFDQATIDPMYIRFPDGRLVRDVDVAFSADDRKKIELGYMCLRCLEPQSSQNADEHIEGCIGVAMYGKRYMRSGRHLVDIAAEFDEREIHVGPARPIKTYLEEQEERKAKREFDAKKGG